MKDEEGSKVVKSPVKGVTSWKIGLWIFIVSG